ncbi:hypothetical protein ACFCT7_06485 [Fulvivirgaceae bacterium LMO-SS25]
MKKSALYIVVLICLSFNISAQKFPEKGVPLLNNFTPDQYLNSGKTWDIDSAPNGIIYLATDKGLLEYDGKRWNIFKGSNGFTRSLLVLNDSTIYTGSDLDFGVWQRNEFLDFEYKSLYSFAENLSDLNEEFWDVFRLKEDIIFISASNIYAIRGEQVVKIAAPERFAGGYKLGENLFIADSEQGLFQLENYSIIPVFSYPNNNKLEIVGMYQDTVGMVMVTKDSGLYRFSNGQISPIQNELSELLRQAKVFSFAGIGQDYLAFGTVLKGLYIVNDDGRIIHQLNRNKGLSSNTILSLHFSRYGQIWIGMDYGISSSNLNTNITSILDYGGNFGNSFTAFIQGRNFYLGTNQGLYQSNWDDLNNDRENFNFSLIPESEGQVWTLDSVGNRLLMGHDKGLYYVNGTTIEKIANQEGVWSIVPYGKYLLAGNYNGISIFEKTGEDWKFERKMSLIYGSCNQLLIEGENILWMNIPNFGIIRTELDKDLEPTNRVIFEARLFEGSETFLTSDETGIHVITDKSTYSFNQSEGKFLQDPEHPKFTNISTSFSGLSKSRLLNANYEFIPKFNGFDLRFLNQNKQTEAVNSNLLIRKIEAFGNSKTLDIIPNQEIAFEVRNLRIEAIVPNSDGIKYQSKLNENDWTPFSTNNSFEFWDLEIGENRLSLKALINENLTEVEEFSIFVKAPWYLSWYAYITYLVIFCLLVLTIYTWFQKSLSKQRRILKEKEQLYLRKQAEKHKQELLLLEQMKLQDEYNQLEQQLKNKTIDLAVKARDNEEKNRLILKIKEIFEYTQNNPSKLSVKLGEVRRLLDSYLTDENKTFEIQMDELHQEFFKKLKEQFPSLSNNDLRWCAYLKIGLNSKEIAEILNILPSSSYISRSRLRKKLNLKGDEDLFDFLNSI